MQENHLRLSFYQKTLFALALLSVFAIALTRVFDYDFWFHLKTGEYIVVNLTIPTKDVFSHTAFGEPWVTHEWLFEVLLFVMWAIGGVSLVCVAKAALVASIFGAYLAGLKKRVGPYLLVTLIAIAAYLAKERYIERPEVISYLFSAIFLCILESFRTDGEGLHKKLFAMPLIMVFWANVHAGALYGLILLGAYVGAEFLGYARARAKGALEAKRLAKRVRALVIIFAATFIAGLINPNTLHAYTYPFLALSISKSTGLNLAEYAAPTWELDAPFFIFLALSAVVMALNFRRTSIAHLGLFALFSYSAIKHNRGIALWAIVMVPIMSASIEGILKDYASKRALLSLKAPLPLIISLVALIAVLAVALSSSYKSGIMGIGIKDKWFPEKAAEFIEANDIGGRMYNSYEFGGYLIWRMPEAKVYLDGRSDVYVNMLKEHRALANAGFDLLMERYGIDYAIMSYEKSNVEYVNIDPYFGSSEGLALVYWDDVSFIYLKRTPQNRPIIDRFGYRAVKPTDESLKYADPARAGDIYEDLQRNIALDPAGWRNHLLLSSFYRRTGNAELALREEYIAMENRLR